MDQQQTPINARLDSSVLPTQPASDWAASTESALGSTTESPSTRGQPSHIIQSNESTGLDTTAKSQSAVEHTLGNTHSAVSTPGQELPGAWSDMPATATQVITDAGNALASVGSAAYNALPQSVKAPFSTQTTNTSPVQTTTNHTTTTPAQNITSTAQSTLSKLAEAGTTAAGTAAAGATAVYERVAGSDTTGIKKDADVMPPHQSATLPSQDVFGLPPHLASDGAGALPGHRDETGVAILPDDKEALANKSNLSTQPTTTGSQPTYTESAKATAAGVVGATTAAAGTVAATAQHAYNKPEEYIPGMPKTMGDTMPYHQTQTLPTQDKLGQLPLSGPMDGVGALPGNASEEGVALLPDEKSNPNPLAASEFAGAKTNKTLVDPYNSESPYSNTDANAIQQPPTAPGVSTKDKVEQKVEDKVTPNKHEGEHPTTSSGLTTKEKVEDRTEVMKDKVMPNKSSTTDSDASAGSPSSPTKKAGFMDKLKGQSKIISGKMSKNEEKIAEGQALKSGGNLNNA